MENKGFTLVEAVISLALLGLVCMTVLSLINNALIIESRNKRKVEMLRIGEMTIEKIKSFNYDSKNELFIFESNMADIIDSFNENKGDVSLNLSSKSQYKNNYNINILKTEKAENIWKICVTVSYDKGENHEEINYRAFITKK